MKNRDRETDVAAANVEPLDRLDRDEQLVERLVKLADSGPEIPAGGAEAVKDAIRPSWQREVRAHGRRRRLTWVGGLAAAATVVIAVGLLTRMEQVGPANHLPVATLAQVVGSVHVFSLDGASRPLHTDDRGGEISGGSRLRTDGTGRAALQMSGGQSVRLDVDTVVQLLSDHSLHLEHGAVYVDSGSRGLDGFEVATPFGVATDIGTQFEVRQSDDEMVIRVREGLVSVDYDGDELEVAHGSQLTVAADGALQRRGIRSHGPEWFWVQEVAPPYAIEGRSAVAFLDWVNRETGLWIRFADSETELQATRAVLHGTLEGLTPLQAPAVVLPSCGLSPRFEGETLVVERIDTD